MIYRIHSTTHYGDAENPSNHFIQADNKHDALVQFIEDWVGEWQEDEGVFDFWDELPEGTTVNAAVDRALEAKNLRALTFDGGADYVVTIESIAEDPTYAPPCPHCDNTFTGPRLCPLHAQAPAMKAEVLQYLQSAPCADDLTNDEVREAWDTVRGRAIAIIAQIEEEG